MWISGKKKPELYQFGRKRKVKKLLHKMPCSTPE